MAERMKRLLESPGTSGESSNNQGAIKKLKVQQGDLFDDFPNVEQYEISFKHRDIVTHVIFTKINILISGSRDGQLKFWKQASGISIQFYKQAYFHHGAIQDIAENVDGTLLCVAFEEKVLDFFNLGNCEITHEIKLPYRPLRVEWIHSLGDLIPAIAVSESVNGVIRVYDGMGTSTPIHTVDVFHVDPVIIMKFNHILDMVVSLDRNGVVEYWTGPKFGYTYPPNLPLKYQLSSDLSDMVMCSTCPTSLAFSPDGDTMAITAMDRKIRVYDVRSGQLLKKIDESPVQLLKLHEVQPQLPDKEFQDRLATEQELDLSPTLRYANVTFDKTGEYVIYATMLGVKIHRLDSCEERILGKLENLRFLSVALYQWHPTEIQLESPESPEPSETSGVISQWYSPEEKFGSESPEKSGDISQWYQTGSKLGSPESPESPEKSGDEISSLVPSCSGPILFCTAFRENRFYLFTRRKPEENEEGFMRDHDDQESSGNEGDVEDDDTSAGEPAQEEDSFDQLAALDFPVSHIAEDIQDRPTSSSSTLPPLMPSSGANLAGTDSPTVSLPGLEGTVRLNRAPSPSDFDLYSIEKVDELCSKKP